MQRTIHIKSFAIILLGLTVFMVTLLSPKQSIAKVNAPAKQEQKKETKESIQEKICIEAIVQSAHFNLDTEKIFFRNAFSFLPDTQEVFINQPVYINKHFKLIFSHLISPQAP